MKQLQVATRLLFCNYCSSLCLSVLSVQHAELFHQSSSLYCLCHCSPFQSLPSTLHLSLPPSLSVSLSISRSTLPLLPAEGPQTAWLNTQANVSLFKETQVVDMLAMGQDQNEELL